MELTFKNRIRIVFSILFLVLTVILSAFSFAKYSSYFDIPLFHRKNAEVKINFCAPSMYANNIYAIADGIPINNYVMKTKSACFNSSVNNEAIHQLKIAYSEALSDLDSVVVYLGSRMFYYTKDNVLNFERDLSGNYIFPYDLKYSKHSRYINDQGIIKSFFTNFMAIFYNSSYFFFAFLSFIFSVLLFPFKFKENKFIIYGIILLGFILRLSDLSLDFWTDEIYTTFIASAKNAPLITTFEDPGNPPFYFILAKIWISLFGTAEVCVRFLSVIISTFSIWMVYKFLKKQFEDEVSLVPVMGAFLVSINLYSIVTAQEARCYALCILLNIMLSYYLFKIIKENKGLILYGALALCAINTHYFEALLLLANFIFGIIFIKKPLKLKFVLANIIAGFSFIPYFLMTALNKGLLNKDFNVFTLPNFLSYIKITDKFLLCQFGFIFVLAFAIYLLQDKSSSNKPYFKTYFYSLYLILSLYLFSYLFSYIKPIVMEYYFVILLPFYVFLTVIILFFPYKNRIAKIFFVFLFIMVFLFFPKSYLKRDKTLLINFKRAASYFATDSSRTKQNSALILPHPYNMYKNAFKEMIPNEKNTLILKVSDGFEKLNEIIETTSFDSYYLRLEFKLWQKIPKEFYKKYKISIIRTGNDIFVVKIEK